LDIVHSLVSVWLVTLLRKFKVAYTKFTIDSFQIVWQNRDNQITGVDNMWITKEFKTREQMNKFIDKNYNKIQWVEIFVNNSYCIEYRKLRKG